MVTSCSAPRTLFTSSFPINSVPPITRTRILSPRPAFQRPRSSVVVFETEMRDELFALHPAQGVLQLHELDENIVLGIEARSRHGRFEIKREPFLNSPHTGALREIHEENQI